MRTFSPKILVAVIFVATAADAQPTDFESRPNEAWVVGSAVGPDDFTQFKVTALKAKSNGSHYFEGILTVRREGDNKSSKQLIEGHISTDPSKDLSSDWAVYNFAGNTTEPGVVVQGYFFDAINGGSVRADDRVSIYVRTLKGPPPGGTTKSLRDSVACYSGSRGFGGNACDPDDDILPPDEEQVIPGP